MDGESDPPQRPQDNKDTGTVNGQDDEKGEGTPGQPAQDVSGSEVTDNKVEEQEGPKNPEEEKEDEENKSKKTKAQLLDKDMRQSGKKEEAAAENAEAQKENDGFSNDNQTAETKQDTENLVHAEEEESDLDNSSGSKTMHSSTGGVDELNYSFKQFDSSGMAPLSPLPLDQTSTPTHQSDPGLRNGNDDTAPSKHFRTTSDPKRPMKSRGIHFANKGLTNMQPTLFSFGCTNQTGVQHFGYDASAHAPSPPAGRQDDLTAGEIGTQPEDTERGGEKKPVTSQTVDEKNIKQKPESTNASAESPHDSGMGTSLSTSSSNPEQDNSLLREEIQQLKTQNYQLMNQLEQQKEGMSRLTEDNNALIVDRDRLNGEKQEQSTELLAFYREKDNQAKQMSELVDERDGLNAECNGLRAYMADLESRNENLQQERANFQDQVSELEREGEEKDANIRELSTTISQNSEMVATAEEKTRSFQDVDTRRHHAELSCSSLQRRLDEATASVQQLEAALKESNEGLGQEIVQLQANLYRLTNERDELQTTSENQVSQLTGDMDALTTKCDSLNVWVEKLTDAKACLEGEKNDLEGKLRRTEKEKNNLIADHEVLEAQNNSSEAAMREIADRTRQLEELKENLEDQVADLQAEVKRKDEHTYGLSDTVARQSHALEGKERLEIEHQDVVTRLSDSQHQCATLQANVTDFTGRTQRLEAALAKEIEDHTREANALKVRVHELSNELGELQESSEREIASLAEVRSTLRSDCDRLNVRVDELENNKKRLEDKNRDLGERLKATERKAEELTTQKRVLERQKKTAEDQSVAYGQTSTVYQAQATQLQDLANAYRAQLETLTAQLRQRNESVLPLEMEARRARLEAQETAAKLERTTNEKDLLVITVDALKAEVQLNALAIQDWHRKEADLRSEMEKQVAQKNRYVKETQLARTQVKKLEERVHQLELQEANRFRRGFPRLD